MPTSDARPLRVALGPAGRTRFGASAIEAGGGVVVALDGAPQGLVWMDPRDVDPLRQLLAATPSVLWVQLPWAGVEAIAATGIFRDRSDLTWTCAKGVYAEEVAEHALALTLACLRLLPERARATSWPPLGGRSLFGLRVLVLGGGGITESLLRLLAPFGCDVTVLRRSPDALTGARRVVGPDALDAVLPDADVLVVALALTPETAAMIGGAELALLPAGAVVVNVARGAHIVTDDLVAALESGHLGGAGLDVTDPEPLPDDHPLFSAPNCVVTPHQANTAEMAEPVLRRRITENVRRWIAGEPLLGLVDPEVGY